MFSGRLSPSGTALERSSCTEKGVGGLFEAIGATRSRASARTCEYSCTNRRGTRKPAGSAKSQRIATLNLYFLQEAADILPETGLEGALFHMLDSESDPKLRSHIQETILSLVSFQCFPHEQMRHFSRHKPPLRTCYHSGCHFAKTFYRRVSLVSR